MYTKGLRKIENDVQFKENETGFSYINILFIRPVAKEIEFRKIDFSYCIFDAGYLRNCKFIDCKFIGVKFKDSNFLGSKFLGCDFRYTLFDKTQIDETILSNGCPTEENLRVKFARSLRMNFQGLGDAISVNKAISLELDSTQEHLYKAWKSPLSYYRKKYTGLERAKMFLQWISFKFLDFVWGNGESAIKLCRTIIYVVGILAIIDVVIWGNPMNVIEYIKSIGTSINVSLGVIKPSNYPPLYLAIIFLVRIIFFGFFMSILIKRFNRR